MRFRSSTGLDSDNSDIFNIIFEYLCAQLDWSFSMEPVIVSAELWPD